MSQARVAEMLGMSQARLAVMERDPASIKVGQLMEILRVLNVQLSLREVPGRGHDVHQLPIGWQQRRSQGRW